MSKTLLLIAKNWPEPNSTAAGRRTIDLLSVFADAGYDVHISSAAEETPFQWLPLKDTYQLHKITVNDSAFDHWITHLKPDIVIFDRFVMEEQFGWRVKQQVPNALTILDTSDLHCLRVAREKAFKIGGELNLLNDQAIREITSIIRCDITIMISNVEVELLKQTFGIPDHLLVYLPFLIDINEIDCSSSFLSRDHCVMIGGFKHEPNRDATRWLKESIWPVLRQRLPKHCEMHVYGGYADHAMNQLNNPRERFFIKGRTEDALETLKQYRVNLAPLRFGAGQKGKILEGWLTGTPTITTPIGAESMTDVESLGYPPTTVVDDFCSVVEKAYYDQEYWQDLQRNGVNILAKNFSRNQFEDRFIQQITGVHQNLSDHRHRNFWGRILWTNQFRASEFMSRWIELKNTD